MTRPGRLATAAVAALAALGGIRMAGCAERLFYWPDRTLSIAPDGVESVFFTNPDGTRLHGWFYRAADAAPGEVRPVVVHSHGNAGNVERHAIAVEFLPEAGVHALVFDYRGYGMSDPARLGREALVSDVLAAVAYVRTRPDVDPARVGLYGISLGGTMALAAAADDPGVACVVSVATFSRWRSVAADHSLGLGWLLVRDGRDAVDSVARLGPRPLLLVHGTRDLVVRYRHAPIIRDAAVASGVDAELLTLDGSGHFDWLDTRPEALDAIRGFFREHLVERPG